MTEREWLTSSDAVSMLYFLRGKASERKLRLSACAYCRSVWELLGNASREAVLLGEQMADDPVNESHRQAVVRAAIESVSRFEEARGDFFCAADMAYRVPCNDGWYAAEWTIGNWLELTSGPSILRDVFGNPFRSLTLVPAWLTPTVVKMAQEISDDRAYNRMPSLADALEEVGCDNTEILSHFRGSGAHVKGCWVVDALLGKEAL
jgi:hypothetical protein